MMFGQVTPAPVEIAAWLGVAAFIVVLANGMFKLKRNISGEAKEIGPQPLRVQSAERFVTVEACESRRMEVERRLEGHDAQIESLWITMRQEDEATRKRASETFESIQRALGRIEGMLKKDTERGL